jgi:NAD+ kinase
VFKSLGIVSRTDRKEAVQLAAEIVKALENRKIEIKSEPRLAKCLGHSDMAVPVGKMKTDIIIIIGGDGTILRTCLRLPKPEPPLLTINMGARGFLAEVEPEEALNALRQTLKGNYRTERMAKVASFLGKRRLPDALNEVSISSLSPAKLLRMCIWKGTELVGECQSDGAVVASQAGSTGYSLSAGGPVVDPDVHAFVFTPIAPLTVFHPIVFPADSTIQIELTRPRKAVIVIDGHYQAETPPELSRITLTKSEYESSFIRFKGNFYHRLKGRLLFSQGRIS